MREKSEFVQRRDLFRYILWTLMAQTAYANRQYYHMFTTWLPHFLTNTAALLLPDALRRLFSRTHKPRNVVEDVLITMVRDNPDYGTYIAPLALGYIVSHPRFNIYKGRMAQLRLAGFGLDAIPHGATAFALASLIVSTLDTMQERNTYRGLLANLLRWGSQKPALTTIAILALLTAFWEVGEYRVFQYEMGIHGDRELINMQWSLQDTKMDVATNMLCCLTAIAWHLSRKPQATAVTPPLPISK
jgi:hypothetical protein